MKEKVVHHHGMENMDGGGFGMMHALMGATWAVFLAAMVAAVVWVLHRRGLLPQLRRFAPAALTARPAVATRHSEAEQFLDMALAKGEIDVAEYHERRSALRSVDL